MADVDLPGIGEVEEGETVYSTSIPEVFGETDDEGPGSALSPDDVRVSEWRREIERIIEGGEHAPRSQPKPRDQPPEPHCAWYCPIHFFGHAWGIYIRESCILSCAIEIARFVDWRVVPGASRGVNLLENSDGSAGGAGWWPTGDARVENCGGNPCFAVRNRGAFHQKVLLPADAEGQYLVAIGSGANERIGESITDNGHLYGLFGTADGFLFVGYLQGQSMRAESSEPNVWVKMSGIFPIPAGAAQVKLDLSQAEARGVPRNGSAARFDDVGLFVFAAESEARDFIARWKSRQE